MNKLEERLNLLEQRLALLESQKASPKHMPIEELLMDLGLAFLISQAHNKLLSEPRFDGYDGFLRDIFKCTITDSNRMEYAHRLDKMRSNLLEKATNKYKKLKSE